MKFEVYYLYKDIKMGCWFKKNIFIFVLKMKEIYIFKFCYIYDLKKKSFVVYKIVLFKVVNIIISNC